MGQLGRIGIAGLNVTLFVLGAFLVAQTLLPVLAGFSDAAAEDVAGAPPSAATARRSWADRQIILRRNLFNASTLAPAPPEPSEEQLEETKLPLDLLGTAVTEQPALSVAAIMDRKERRHRVVRVGDRLGEAAAVTVVRIEQRRVVLRNGARLEELVIEDETGAKPPSTARPRARRSARAAPRASQRSAARAESLGKRIRRLSNDRFSVPRSDVRAAADDPTNLFSQARILPKYENGQMVGLQLNAIKSDSLFERIGIQNGDTVTQFNGIRIQSPAESANLLRELADASEFAVVVRGADGAERTLTYQLEDDEAR